MVDGMLEPLFLFEVGQVAVIQQIGGLQEVGFASEIGDVVTAIAQDALVAIDIGDLGFATGGR